MLPCKPLPARPDLEALMKASVDRYNALSAAQRRDLHDGQRRSWVIGEMMIEHPEMTREKAEAIYENL